jgi:hypothetical protein
MTEGQDDVVRRFALDLRLVVNSSQTIAILPAFEDRAAQISLLRLFDPGTPDVVRVAEADDLRGQRLIRVAAFLFFLPVKTGITRQIVFFQIFVFQDLIDFLRRVFIELARQPDEAFPAFFGFAQIFRTSFGFSLRALARSLDVASTSSISAGSANKDLA